MVGIESPFGQSLLPDKGVQSFTAAEPQTSDVHDGLALTETLLGSQASPELLPRWHDGDLQSHVYTD